jgi:EmrB/QacA subfamily drug resistance transporter
MIAQHDHKNRTYTVIGIALAMFLGALDQTIVSTALPRIVSELGGLERYTWVTTVYLLVSTLLVPLYGKLSDIMNRKTLELWSIVVFLLGSALCGTAGDWGALSFLGDGMTQLIIFRGIQGLGGAGLFALAFIIISDLYPPRDRGKIGGVFGAVFGLSSVLGPLIGGFLTDNAGAWLPPVEGWRWVFYVNLPIGAVALWFISAKMPRLHPHDHSHRLDLASAGLMIAAFFPLVLALQLDKTQHSWSSPEVLGLLAGGVVLLAGWIGHSLYISKHPILDLRLFKNPVFTTGVIAAFFFGAAFLSILVFLPLYMVNVQGVSATQAGASVIPLTLGIVLGAGLGGPVATKLGKYKAILVVGSLVALAGGLLMTLFAAGTSYWIILTAMVITGMGFGPAQSLYSVAIQNSVPVKELGQATSFSQFSRQIGSTVGAAVAGALFSATIAAAFAATLGAGATGHSVSQGDLRKGPKEIRAEIAAGFDKTIAQVETLFELRGDEAKKQLAVFLADPNVPAILKDKLKNGTPAVQIEEEFDKLEADLEAIVVSGDRKALAALFASEEGRPLPDASRAGIEALMGLSAPARKASVAQLREQMIGGRDKAIEGTNLIATARVKAELEKARDTVADQTVGKIAQAFSLAIAPIWWLNVVLLALLVVATAAIPSLPLRGKGDHAPAPVPAE